VSVFCERHLLLLLFPASRADSFRVATFTDFSFKYINTLSKVVKFFYVKIFYIRPLAKVKNSPPTGPPLLRGEA
jgi:hypothetical protein